MKKTLFSILVFIVWYISSSCGWYPPENQDDNDSWLFNPFLVNEKTNTLAHYQSYFEMNDKVDMGNVINSHEWAKYTKFSGDINAIMHILYVVTPDGFSLKVDENVPNEINRNPFIVHIKSQYPEVLAYLKLAKSAETLNINSENFEDPWAEYDYYGQQNLSESDAKKAEDDRLNSYKKGLLQLMSKIENQCEKTKDPFMRMRYAFQLTRLSHYANEPESVQAYYEKYIVNNPTESILKYWAMGFYAITQTDEGKKHYLLSLVYANAQNKRTFVKKYFDKEKVPLAIGFAKNNDEIANLYYMQMVDYPGRALPSLKEMAKISINAPVFQDFMVKEVLKIEKWVSYPKYKYKLLLETTNNNYFNKDYYLEEELNRAKNYAKDLVYLRDVQKFAAECAENRNIAQKEFWHLINAYLAFVDNDLEKANLISTKVLESGKLTTKLRDQAQIIRLVTRAYMCGSEEERDVVLMNEIKFLEKTAEKNYYYYRSLNKIYLTMASLYRAKRNFVKEVLCYTKVLDMMKYDELNAKIEQAKQSPNKHLAYEINDIYAYEYTRVHGYEFMSFLDNSADIPKMEQVMAYLSKTGKTEVEKFWAKESAAEMNRLWDLLGVKYIRENKLAQAKDAFAKVDKSFWKSVNEPYNYYLEANPFFANSDGSQSIPNKEDNIRFDKYTVVDSLMKVLAKAENPNTKNREKYYFIAANCYLNMTYWGNSWIMTSYYRSVGEPWNFHEASKTKSVSNYETWYYTCSDAKALYEKAYNLATNQKSKALALQMIKRCDLYAEGSEDETKIRLKYKKFFEERFPAYAKDMRQCTNFDSYWQEVIKE
jgi:hypothetical protein